MATDAELTKIAHETAAKMREFHLDDFRVMREYMDGRFDSMQTYMDGRFEKVEGKIDLLETQVAQVTSALHILLEEFKQHRTEVSALKKEVIDLRTRLEVLEAKVAV